MFTLYVNGQAVSSLVDKKLLDFLRDDLRLTSVKNGCAEGACGSCSVLIDGKNSRSCLLKLSALAGKNVLTVEGLTKREKEVYAYAFAAAGAVQCGFCTPGMVICAKGLLDTCPEPDEVAIRRALRGNICRCTGYVKIVQAVELAAKLLRENIPVPNEIGAANLGEPLFRVDATAKTLGTGIYVDDKIFPGMLYASALRSRYPRARLLAIDSTAALSHPDCVAVLTARDVPGHIKIGHLAHISDWDVLIAEGGITRYVGDAVALAVSHKKESLDEIKALIQVDYEELPALTSPAMALAVGAPKIHEKGNILAHEHLVRGDVESAIRNASHVVRRQYSLPFTEHAFMEPECAIALPENDGLLLYTAGQSIYDEQREIARMLGVEPDLIHITGQLVGGGFGGKEDMSVQHHAALAAWILRRPVKVLLSRQESLIVHPKRHAMELDFTTACDAQGRLTALKAVIVSDTGAYASLGGPVLQRACTHAGGPYNFQNIDVEGTAVYTNNPPGGAFRGFGVSQSAVAMESNLNLLAELVGISPWEIRRRNAVKPGDTLPNGQIADSSTAVIECLDAVKPAYENSKTAGVACFFKNSGVGVGLPDAGRCIISVEQGKIHLRTSAACVGQGLATVITQIACHTLSLPPQLFVAEPPDTRRTPNAGTTTASRQTLFTGEAVRRAANQLKQRLDEGAALADLEGEEFFGEYLGVTDPMGSGKEHPVSHVAYGYAAQVVELDEDGRISKITAACDAGRIVNPQTTSGQIEGGIVMSLGYALTEDYPLQNGYPQARFGKLGLWRADMIPEMEIMLVRGEQALDMAYGAKGVGELSAILTAPAVMGAYYARDGVFRNKLPLENTYYR